MKAWNVSRSLFISGLVVALLGGAVVVGQAQAQGMMHTDHPGSGMRHEGGMMGFMGGGRMIERMLDSVNATEAQRSQIRQITDAARKDMQSQHDAGRSLRDEALQLFTQPTVDARAAEAVRQKMLAQHEAGSKRAMQAMLDISRVLTPEQRASLADKLKQRRAMHEQRHSHERRPADAAPR